MKVPPVKENLTGRVYQKFADNVAKYSVINRVEPGVAFADIVKKNSKRVIAVGDTTATLGGISLLLHTAVINPLVSGGLVAVGLFTGNLGRAVYLNSVIIRNLDNFIKTVEKNIPKVRRQIKPFNIKNIFNW